MTKIQLLFVLLCGACLSFPAAAQMYKWVDKKGTTHYGETIPPEYADRDRLELNKSGRVVKSIEFLSPDEQPLTAMPSQRIKYVPVTLTPYLIKDDLLGDCGTKNILIFVSSRKGC